MRLIYLTDLHDSIEELEALLSLTDADLYLISGDLLYRAFESDEELFRFIEIQEEFYRTKGSPEQDETAFDLSQRILKDRDSSFERKKRAEEYLRLSERARNFMLVKYGRIEEILRRSRKRAFLIPGNYDMDLENTPLRDYNLHRKSRPVDGLLFAGYGGAPVVTSGIPEQLAVDYGESIHSGRSRPGEFLGSIDPHILMIHNPAFGFLDLMPSRGHMGSRGVREYLDSHHPLIVLSGHIHEDYGIRRRKNTLFLNPSAFGRTESSGQPPPSGLYGEILIEGQNISRLYIKSLKEERKTTLVELDARTDRVRRIVPGGSYPGIDLRRFQP